MNPIRNAFIGIAFVLATMSNVAAAPATENHAYVFEIANAFIGASFDGTCVLVPVQGWALGPTVANGIDQFSFSLTVCPGDTPRTLREKMGQRVLEIATEHGYVLRKVNIVVPSMDRAE